MIYISVYIYLHAHTYADYSLFQGSLCFYYLNFSYIYLFIHLCYLCMYMMYVHAQVCVRVRARAP